MDKRPLAVLIAGGKTGGHLFPGIAIARALQRREVNTRILFVGTGEAFEVAALEREGFCHEAIASYGIKGKRLVEKLASLAQVPLSVAQAAKIIGRFSPDMVIGVGGYSSGPVVLAARLLNRKTAIHEQNTIPGITNRILSRFVHTVFTSFQNTRGLAGGKRVVCTGNPIRKRADAAGPGAVPEALPEASKEGRDFFTLLVTGGSQGASSINKAVVTAVQQMARSDKELFVIHQTGERDEKTVHRAYQAMGIKAVVKEFFHDMPAQQARADLIICRAGAGTLAEITALGKPSILVPYPHAADDHQRFNAVALADHGAAVMILDRDLSGNSMAEAIFSLKNNPQRLALMAEAAQRSAKPGADETIAEIIMAMAGFNGELRVDN
ncbi:MAG: undecaprenyldiphospho-muramoylpentapeptide beta-N-acetylglucosaminyltransferase [Desulfobacteraceae bacterium]